MNTSPTERIKALKQKLGDDLFILGHHYQHDSVIRHTDLRGDSLELSRRVEEQSARHIVFCGVFFMAESAAILAKPEQQVHIPDTGAKCIMSAMAPSELVAAVLSRLSEETGRRIIPLTYVNSSAAVKAVCGAAGGSVCTSANASTMLTWALSRGDAVMFLPDMNLGRNTANQLSMPESERHILDIRSGGTRLDIQAAKTARLLLWPGCCAIHNNGFKLGQIRDIRAREPEARIVVHPESKPEVVDASDGAGSTTFLIRYCADAPAGATIYVGTESNLVYRLAEQYKGEKTIRPLAVSTCSNMARVTEAGLADKLEDIASGTASPVVVSDDIAEPANKALTRMLEACS